jgi:hypothetical protein
MARLRSENVDQLDIDEALDELDQNIKRLRIEYEQHFVGTLKRPPSMLQGQVQKVIQTFSAQPPRSTRQKFRFNQLNSRYQVFRQQWGRTLRQIEEGTYKPHRFRVKQHEKETPIERSAAAPEPAARAPGGLDALYGALLRAHEKLGEGRAAPDRARLEEMVRRQTAEIRARHGDAKIRFKVVTENGRAKVMATVSKS